MRSNFGQPNSCLNCFYLTEERAYIAERVMPPMLQQPRGFGSDSPSGLGELTPLIHKSADLADAGCRFLVLLIVTRKPVSFVETQPALGLLLFFRLWYGRDISGLAALVDDALCRLPLL